LLNP
jgi:hypothetical protein